MNLPSPILIGYFPKKTASSEDFRDAGIKQICSMSACISSGPDDWINAWKHNEWFVFDTEQLAGEVVEDHNSYDLFAYKLFPVVFGENVEPIEILTTALGDLAGYEFLGYDPVCRSVLSTFDHSPLSCNYGFQKFQVNEYCLLDDLEDAWRITTEIARDAAQNKSWEPGPYYLCAIYRKMKSI